MSSKVLAIVTVAAAFVAGLLVGVVGDRIYIFTNRDRVRHDFARRVTPHIINRLERELDLTPQQRQQVAKIVEERHRRIESLSRSIRPQIDKELQRANDEISRILTPEQRKKFDKMKMRLLRPRHGPGPHHARPGPHPPPPVS